MMSSASASRDCPPDIAGLPPQTVYKADARSRVWRVDVDGDAWVIKRFEYAAARQALARWLGIHPAQRERRANRRLARDGVPVIAIEARGVDRGRSWLATRWRGDSLDRWWGGAGEDARQRVAHELGELVARLWEHGWFYKDLKASNIVVDAERRVWLIDVGSARRGLRDKGRQRMLAMLEKTCREAGFTDGNWRGVTGRCGMAG